MTPDELRRMDNDLCIIFEKGIKPVKANKFYYFKNRKMSDALNRYHISHNDDRGLDRGTWRKFNPYNPWTEDKTDKEVQNLKVESLDDLFDDEPKKENEPKKEPVKIAEVNEKKEEPQSIDNFFDDVPTNDLKQEIKSIPEPKEEDSYDLQKELEAKFDELFGSIDDDNK